MTVQELFDSWYRLRRAAVYEYSTSITQARLDLHNEAVRVALALTAIAEGVT